MRLLFLTESYSPRVGGTPTQVRLLAEDMARCGHTVSVLTRRWEPAHPSFEEREGIRIFRYGPTGYGPIKKWQFGARLLPVLLGIREADAIYCAGVRVLGGPAVIAARRKGWCCILRPVSCGEMSGAFFEEGLRRKGIRAAVPLLRGFVRFRNHLLKKADRFVAISRAIEEELAMAGMEAKRIVRIPNAVDEDRFAPPTAEKKQRLRNALGLEACRPLVLYTGRLVRSKGLPHLLQAWNRLADDFPEAHLLLVGGGGNDIGNCEAELRAFCKANGLERRVTFTGDVSDVVPWLQASDVFVFPTLNEAFGISLIEAMACGLPCITTAVGGVRDIVEDGENALVIPPENAGALEAAFRRLWSDPTLAQRLGTAGRRTVQERYGHAAVARQYETLFKGAK